MPCHLVPRSSKLRSDVVHPEGTSTHIVRHEIPEIEVLLISKRSGVYLCNVQSQNVDRI